MSRARPESADWTRESSSLLRGDELRRSGEACFHQGSAGAPRGEPAPLPCSCPAGEVRLVRKPRACAANLGHARAMAVPPRNGLTRMLLLATALATFVWLAGGARPASARPDRDPAALGDGHFMRLYGFDALLAYQASRGPATARFVVARRGGGADSDWYDFFSVARGQPRRS